MQENKRYKLYLILSNISVILLFYSIWEIKPVVVDINDFLGLTSHITFSYWIGLSLIVACSIMVYLDKEKQNDFILLYILIVFGLFLFGLGVFAEENARAWSSYYPTAEVKNVLETGYIDTISDYPLVSYRSWPAFHFISAFVLSSTGIELASFIKYMPLFWILCYTLVTFAIGRRIIASSSQAFLFSFIAISSFWQIYYYYSPQSYAYIAFLYLVMLMITFGDFFRTRLMIILIFIMLTISHLLYCAISLALSSVHLLREKRLKLTILMFAVFVAWYAYLAPVAFKMGVFRFIETGVNLDITIFSQIEKYTPNTPMKKQVDFFRFSYLFIFAVCLAISGIIYRYGQIENDKKNLIKTCFYWLIVIALFGLSKYGEESFERAYLFSIIPIVSIIVLSFSNLNKKFLAILMVLLTSIHIPAHYGSEGFMATRTSELRGAEFLASKVDLLSLNTPPLGVQKGVYIYPSVGGRYVSFYNQSAITVKSRDMEFVETPNYINKLRYIVWGIHSSNLLIYYSGEDSIQQWIDLNENNVNITKIYNNGGLNIYENRVTQPEWARLASQKKQQRELTKEV